MAAAAEGAREFGGVMRWRDGDEVDALAVLIVLTIIGLFGLIVLPAVIEALGAQ